MLLRIYERLLERKIKRVPRHIVVICSEVKKEFEKFVEWCRKFGVKEITLCLNSSPRLKLEGVRIRYIENSRIREMGSGEIVLNIISGYSGKDEITSAIKKLAEMVAKGLLDPSEVSEEHLEKLLAVRSQPDMIVKAGNEIPEFLIWQSIYSELFFADIDWKTFRYVDFLRMLREYQRRERRYGR